jgi:polyhydroxyalkanoate synthesis repressor PhaR
MKKNNSKTANSKSTQIIKKTISKVNTSEINQNKSENSNGVKILIRKYENRRLYSVAAKSYINLDDISGYINEGKKIKVVEVISEKDITCEILLQILLQQGKADLIPQEVLEIMVRMNNAWLKKFWSPYFDKSIRMVFELNPLLAFSTKDIFKNWFLK